MSQLGYLEWKNLLQKTPQKQILQYKKSAFVRLLSLLQKKMNVLRLVWLLVALLLIHSGRAISSTPPVWVSSSFFKAGAVTFVFASSTTTAQNTTVVYSSQMVSTSLKVPTLGITDLGYKIQSGQIRLLLVIVAYTRTFLTFQTQVNDNSRLNSLKITYMALDSSFTPAFSMNYFFPRVNRNGTGWSAQYYVNFTASTGVTLNTSHDNALIPFMHYINCDTNDGTISINLDFSLVNASYYTVIISTTSNMYLEYAGFSRLIFDKTAIEALGNDYFHYGIVTSTNDNATQLLINIPPDIIPENLFFGLHSFHLTSGTSWLDFSSTYNITSGDLQLTRLGSYSYQQMKYSYMHHKTRTCPPSHPYYNISELLCYDQCAVGWYADLTTMTCKQCLYDCQTCTNGSACATCDSVTDHRVISLNRCAALSGYYDTGLNDPIAAACSSPCATCVTAATYCLSCVSGYYLNGSSCLSCSAAITNCSQCTNSSYCTLCNDGSNGSSCTICSNTEYKSGATCISCALAITNCLRCSSSSDCTLCQNTFTLNSPTSCTCNSSQYLSGGSCHLCSDSISNCQSCSSASTCTACKSTYTLLSATNCGCSSTTFLNTTTSQCQSCTQVVAYCQSCTSTTCSTCMSNFTLNSNTCTCPSGYYPNSTSLACQSCAVISNCLTCTDVSTCTSCATGYRVNTTTHQCDVQPCTVSNCDTCISNSTTWCQGCYSGYSITALGTCTAFCGNGALSSSQQCDDGNTLSGDGCSSTCQVETGFSCYKQIINATNSYSWCFYTATISFSKIWIRKYEGNNSLKFQFKLNQQIQEWKNVNFTNILAINQVDQSTKIPTGLIESMVQSYTAGYSAADNRFWVILNYVKYSMENQYLSFELTPYAHNAYPAFTPPNSIEFIPSPIIQYITVSANNNQNANIYSDYMYSLYSISVVITYIVVGTALVAILTSLVFRTGSVITFEMITVMQITYFSLASLDSINPVFSGLLPLRYLAGILTFQDVEAYLEQTTSPNAMKGIYMFLNLSSNFSWVAVGFSCFIGFGALLIGLYYLADYCANSNSLVEERKSLQQRSCFVLYRIAFHFIGELSIALLFYCLPLYTISLFFEALYTHNDSQFWSYAQGVGVGIIVICYFVALIQVQKPKVNKISKLGEYLTQFSFIGCFQTFKYVNFLMIEVLVISGLVMATIYSNSKIFSAFCIVLIAVFDIVIVSVVKPYRYGFISCFKGEENDTEVLFEKIELYKVYDKEQPSVIRIENPDLTQKSEENQNTSEVFAQHFATRKNMIKSRHQGLVQAGQTLNQTKLFLFNNNTRRIVDLATLILVQFVFICTKIYGSSINQDYASPSIECILPLFIHIFLFLNVFYNYAMLLLQILDRRRDSIAKVDIMPEPDTSSQFNKSLYTQTQKPLENNSTLVQTTIQTNKLIIKKNGTATSLYDLKRPQIIKSEHHRKKKKAMTNVIAEQ